MYFLSLTKPNRNRVLSRCLIAGMIITVFLFLISLLRTEQRAAAAAEELSQAVLRFHVRADDDSEEAQALKLQVRDEILRFVKPLLTDAKDRSEAEEILAQYLTEIEAAAEAITAESGQGELVCASLTEEAFPVRTYGSVTFPAGIYHSLTVTIGSGQGHNWWCVMYPTLCFQDAASTDISAESEASLCDLLSPETQDILVEEPEAKSKTDSVPRVRFLIFPILNLFF